MSSKISSDIKNESIDKDIIEMNNQNMLDQTDDKPSKDNDIKSGDIKSGEVKSGDVKRTPETPRMLKQVSDQPAVFALHGMSYKQAKTALIALKKNILSKRIMMNILVQYYTKIDRTFKYIQTFLSVTSAGCAALAKFYPNAEPNNTILLVATIGTVVCLRLRTIFNVERHRHQARDQILAYSSLFDKIDNEFNDSVKTESYGIVVELINKEYNNIAKYDPEIDSITYEKYKKICKENKIPINDEISEFKALLSETEQSDLASAVPFHTIDIGDKKDDKDNIITPKLNRDNTQHPAERVIDTRGSKSPGQNTVERGQNTENRGQTEKNKINILKRLDTSHIDVKQEVNIKADLKYSLDRLQRLDED